MALLTFPDGMSALWLQELWKVSSLPKIYCSNPVHGCVSVHYLVEWLSFVTFVLMSFPGSSAASPTPYPMSFFCTLHTHSTIFSWKFPQSSFSCLKVEPTPLPHPSFARIPSGLGNNWHWAFMWSAFAWPRQKNRRYHPWVCFHLLMGFSCPSLVFWRLQSMDYLWDVPCGGWYSSLIDWQLNAWWHWHALCLLPQFQVLQNLRYSF